MNELEQLRQRVDTLESMLKFFIYPTQYRFIRPINGGTDGLKIGTAATDKLGLYGKTPIAQFSSNSGRSDVQDNTGSAANIGFRATGNTGSKGYSLGDIVYLLKTRGDIAS